MNERELRLLRSIRDSLTTIQEEICSIRDQQERNKQQRNVQPLWLQPVLSARQEAEANKTSGDNRQYRVQLSFKRATWCAFAAAAIYAGIAALQKDVMVQQTTAIKESNLINKEALEAVQRALMINEAMTYEFVSQVDNKKAVQRMVTFRARFVNTGNTTSRGIVSALGAKRMPKRTEPTEADFVKAKPYRMGVTGPKEPVSIGGYDASLESLVPKDITTQPARPANSPTMYFWGWLTYRDVFPNTKVHLTEFCHFITQTYAGVNTGSPTKEITASAFLFESCVHHNCVDPGLRRLR